MTQEQAQILVEYFEMKEDLEDFDNYPRSGLEEHVYYTKVVQAIRALIAQAEGVVDP